MKKILMLLIIAIVGVSCISEDMDSTKLDLKHLDPFVEKMAPVKEGYITIIKSDTFTVCQTDAPIKYLFPKGKEPKISYIQKSKDYQNGGYFSFHFVASFEDTKNGDNDYNDFIAFITVVKKQTGPNNNDQNLEIYVQPLACGAGNSTNLKFGIKFNNGKIWMASNNVRQDFFDGTSGFINVHNDEATPWVNVNVIYPTNDIHHIKRCIYGSFAQGSNGDLNPNYRINPFVINGNDTIFLAIFEHNLEKEDYNNIVNLKGYPLGIATSDGYHWPLEKINIKNCYYNFNNWITGSDQILNISSGNYEKLKTFYTPEKIIRYNPEGLDWTNASTPTYISY